MENFYLICLYFRDYIYSLYYRVFKKYKTLFRIICNSEEVILYFQRWILYFHRLRKIIIIIIILNCIEARKAFISRFGIAQDKTLYYGKSNKNNYNKLTSYRAKLKLTKYICFVKVNLTLFI